MAKYSSEPSDFGTEILEDLGVPASVFLELQKNDEREAKSARTGFKQAARVARQQGNATAFRMSVCILYA